MQAELTKDMRQLVAAWRQPGQAVPGPGTPLLDRRGCQRGASHISQWRQSGPAPAGGQVAAGTWLPVEGSFAGREMLELVPVVGMMVLFMAAAILV